MEKSVSKGTLIKAENSIFEITTVGYWGFECFDIAFPKDFLFSGGINMRRFYSTPRGDYRTYDGEIKQFINQIRDFEVVEDPIFEMRQLLRTLNANWGRTHLHSIEYYKYNADS